jgi:hypothetical protein
MDIDLSEASEADKYRIEASAYLNGMLKFTAEELLAGKASMRGDKTDLINSVRLRLKIFGSTDCEAIGDAVAVLQKLNAGGLARFF